ncbi:DUF6438 domain-containing protein [Hymenobacter psoromatis]|uniref:DUF6438 domain-containing protein n=1 Tax=Hymenobacter psoromatis TaxID=1484116 RepID=UPI001CBC72AD|nr:DUF6438 domain-containing protein [Hymenobacter psoromatis]
MRFLLWLLLLTLPACAQKKMPRASRAATAPTPPRAAQPEPVLVFQRTPCYGTCPAYTATIFADGRVEYEGQRFVPVVGKRTLSLPPTKVAALLAEAQRIGFSQLDERYAGNTSDLPATLIKVHPAGQPAKSVFAEENIPANLQGYINYLKGQLDPLAGMALKE